MRVFSAFLVFIVALFCALPLSIYGKKVSLNLNSLDGLGDLLQGIAGASKQREDGSCPSACEEAEEKNSSFSVPKLRIRPYSNGCSVPQSMRTELGDYSIFDTCCDLHDACYSACGMHKQKCENEFGVCMGQQCQATYKKSDPMYSECFSMGDTFMLGTSMFGCGGYEQMQIQHCDCLPKKEAKERMREYLLSFYNHYNRTRALPGLFLEKYVEEANSDKERQENFGLAIYYLYKTHPQSVEIISRDGKGSREKATYFGDHEDNEL